MLYLLSGFAAATFWGLFRLLAHGQDALMDPLTGNVFWALISTGFVLTCLNAFVRCPVCKRHPKIPVICAGNVCH